MVAKLGFYILLIQLLNCLALSLSAEDLMAGKTKTDRTIHLDAIVDASPAEVYGLWSSPEGVKKFFAPEAEIGKTPGEPYTIIFAPDSDPKGLSHGTRGARILKMEPGKFLSFEWITFAGDTLLGKNAPPLAPPALRNAVPLPTWVELTFESIPGSPQKTHLKFAHYGFGDTQLWQQSFEWFSRAWKGVLEQLVAYCKSQKTGK